MQDQWRTETGLQEDFSGTIDTAVFTTDSRYKDGEVLLMSWECRVDDPVDPTQGTRSMLFSCGNGWSSNDGGQTAVHDSGRENKAFNKSSMYGRIIEWAKGEPELMAEFARRGKGPNQADVWEGIRVRFGIVHLEYGKGIDAQDKLLPVEFLGVSKSVEGGGGNGQAAGTSTSAAAPAAAAPTATTDAVLLAKLNKLARDSSSHQEFVDAAMDLPGVTDDENLLERVVEESKLYAEARG